MAVEMVPREGRGRGWACAAWLAMALSLASAQVLELDDSSFQTTVGEAELAVVVFHAPWCHHCHSFLTNIFSPAAELLRSEDITMATLDIETAKEVQNRYVIQQVPTVRLFRNGQMFPYDGPGQHTGVEELVRYLREESGKQGLGENPVITLTNDNFDDIITTSELMLVEFYTDLCVPCQRLEPIFADAARQLLMETPPIRLGRVQIPDQMKVAERFPLQGYPLLIMFRYGAQYIYTGPKESAADIVEYMRRQAGPSSILLEQTGDVQRFINQREVSVVGYFHDDTDSNLRSEFLESGNLVRTDMKLGHTLHEGVARDMGQQLDSIVVYHPVHLVSSHETGYSVILSAPANATQLRQLYLEHARPLVGQMTQSNHGNLYKHRPLLVAYYDVDWSRDGIKATQYWHGILASVAHKFSLTTDIVFAIANEEDFPDDLWSLGLVDWGEDVAVAIFAPGPLKFPMEEDDFSTTTLTSFIQDYLDRELNPYFSSEPVPKPVKWALIRKVVGSNYLSEVGNKKKDVMVLLCRPELSECREAEEFYQKLATQFQGVKDLVFSEMNLALNDPPVGTDTSSLPLFLFSPRGSTEISPVSPAPKDEADLAFFLKYTHHIKPLRKTKGKKKDEL